MRTRLARSSDLPFLSRVLVEATYPPWHEPRPSPAEARRDPRAGRYLREWGRQGDTAIVAVEGRRRRIGASWYRCLPSDEPGHGFVDADTPELTIAVSRHRRGRGVGTLLITHLLVIARRDGVQAISLSVSTANPAAVALYRRAGPAQRPDRPLVG